MVEGTRLWRSTFFLSSINPLAMTFHRQLEQVEHPFVAEGFQSTPGFVTERCKGGACYIRLPNFRLGQGRPSYSSAMVDSPHILVVDDDREIRDLLGRFLDEHGLRVLEA